MRGALAAAVLACSLAGAAPAQAKRPRHKPPAVRPEDDPRLAGDAKAFARATVALQEPADGTQVEPSPGGLRVALEVSGYALGALPTASPGAARPHALLLVDNVDAFEIDGPAPIRLRGLKPGPHLLRVVLSRPWGEVVKAPGAFALARVWVGKRPQDEEAAQAAEARIFPDPRKPLLTYVFPLGKPDPALSIASEGAGGAAATEAAPETVTTAAVAPATATAAATATASAPPPSPPLSPRPPRPALDFFLSGASLRPDGRGHKVRVVIDRRELPLVRAWRPLQLKLSPGPHRVTIDLLDRLGTKVSNAVNRTDRSVLVPDAGDGVGAAQPADR